VHRGAGHRAGARQIGRAGISNVQPNRGPVIAAIHGPVHPASATRIANRTAGGNGRRDRFTGGG
jgi:hypothetical protein